MKMNPRIVVLLLTLVAFGTIIAAVAYRTRSVPAPVTIDPNNSTSTSEPIREVQSNAPTFQLVSGATVNVPFDWNAEMTVADAQFTNYEFVFSGGNVRVAEVNVSNWLKGPRPEEGYVIPHVDRTAAFMLLKNIYDHKAFTAADAEAFKKQAGEFLGYSASYRTKPTYFESSDKTYRGIAFFNLSGQSPLLSPLYYISLYNAENNTIVWATYELPPDSPELIKANAWFKSVRDWEAIGQTEATKRTRQVHEDFKTFLETSPRHEWSFGDSVNNVDEILRSLRFDPTQPLKTSSLVPLYVHPAQIIKKVGQFALVARPSVNVSLPDLPTDFEARFSGVLIWNEESRNWKPFLSVEDTESGMYKTNNPVDYWQEGPDGTETVPHLLVVDTAGAGSGEGIGKVFVAEDIELEHWKLTDCFYYAYDSGRARAVSLASQECQGAKVERMD